MKLEMSIVASVQWLAGLKHTIESVTSLPLLLSRNITYVQQAFAISEHPLCCLSHQWVWTWWLVMHWETGLAILPIV